MLWEASCGRGGPAAQVREVVFHSVMAEELCAEVEREGRRDGPAWGAVAEGGGAGQDTVKEVGQQGGGNPPIKLMKRRHAHRQAG